MVRQWSVIAAKFRIYCWSKIANFCYIFTIFTENTVFNRTFRKTTHRFKTFTICVISIACSHADITHIFNIKEGKCEAVNHSNREWPLWANIPLWRITAYELRLQRVVTKQSHPGHSKPLPPFIGYVMCQFYIYYSSTIDTPFFLWRFLYEITKSFYNICNTYINT